MLRIERTEYTVRRMPVSRCFWRGTCCLLLTVVTSGGAAAIAQDTKFPAKDAQIPGPNCLSGPEGPLNYTTCTPARLAEWLKDIRHWRDETRIRAGYNDSQYRRPELEWAQSSFMQPQLMAEDRYFFDPAKGKYTVGRYLDDVKTRFGGIDSVLVWQSYPNIGIDNRSQYDLIRALPGGIPALRAMVDEFHKNGVKVLFPMMMWDQGTHAEATANWESTANIMAEIGADGVNGDTMYGVPRAFRDASDKTGHPLVFEPEGYPSSPEMLSYNNMSWGYWDYPFAPLVSEGKLLEPRHMINISDRWNRSKTDDLQFAFFNGVGLETWENIWSIWNGITPRGAETIRRVATVERAIAPFLISQDWEPLTPTVQFGVFASRWPLKSEAVFTIVNRNEYSVTGPQIELPYSAGLHYYDLWHGTELTPSRAGDFILLSFEMEGHGFGAVLVSAEANDASIQGLMQASRKWGSRPLNSLSDEWKPLSQKMVTIAKTRPPAGDPAGMVKIPAGDFLFRVDGLEIEGDNGAGVDVQYPWEDSPRRHHVHAMRISGFWMDKYPTTNAEFKKFLDASHYHPKDDYNFVKDWRDGSYPVGWENKPVTWVSQEDARVYAAWAGKRLPHEWEWQYAAQGTDQRAFPWGNAWSDQVFPLPSHRTPLPDKARELTAPDNVDAHPDGASPFGVMDMVGNVWQWTDEFQDEHTRTAIVRGGSYYQPQGSMWYFPNAYRNTEHGKYLLMAPSKDRAGTLGFRCVMDAE